MWSIMKKLQSEIWLNAICWSGEGEAYKESGEALRGMAGTLWRVSAERILRLELGWRSRDVKSNTVEVSKTFKHYASQLDPDKAGFRITRMFENTCLEVFSRRQKITSKQSGFKVIVSRRQRKTLLWHFLVVPHSRGVGNGNARLLSPRTISREKVFFFFFF